MILTADTARSIERFAREAYPYECCGALLGGGASVALALLLANTSDEPKVVALHQDAAGRIRPTTVAALQRRIWDRLRVECLLEPVERFLQVTIEGEVALSIECLLQAVAKDEAELPGPESLGVLQKLGVGTQLDEKVGLG